MTKVLLDGVVYQQQRTGGISRCFSEILSRIADTCDDVELLLHLPPQCYARLPKGKRIRTIKDPRIRPGRFFNRPVRCCNQLRAKLHRPNIFHSTYYTDPYWDGLRTVVTVHDFIDEKFPVFFGNTEFCEKKRRVINAADAIIAVSENTKADAVRFAGADPDRITVVHHGPSAVFSGEADPGVFAKRHGIGAPYWLYVGDRVHYKNFGTLLRAFVRVADKTDGSLVLLGGNTGALVPWQEDLLVQHRLEQRVYRFAYVEDDELRQAYAGAAAFVFPSLEEGFGIPLLEAMASGTPIIASDIPVFHEVAADAAMFFDPHDQAALAEAMVRVLDGPARDALVAAGQRRVHDFSWDDAARKVADIYRSLA